MAYGVPVSRLPEERGRMLDVVGRNPQCELYNVLRCSTAYRITLCQSNSYADVAPLSPAQYREDSPSPLPWGYPCGPEASGDGTVRRPTPHEQCSPVAHSGELPGPSTLADVVDEGAQYEAHPEILVGSCAQSRSSLGSCRLDPADGDTTYEDISAETSTVRPHQTHAEPSPQPQPSPHSSCSLTPAGSEYSQPTAEDSDEDYMDIPSRPPHHTRPGPSRRMPSLRPPPSPTHHTRVHKPKGKTDPRSGKKGRRRVARLNPDTLQRLRTEYALSLEGDFSLKEHTVQRPMKVGQEPCPWLCPWSGCGQSCAREEEAKRHTLTHHPIRWLCGNPRCLRSFSRKDVVKRHLMKVPSCSSKLPSGTTVHTDTPMVELDMSSAQHHSLIYITWVEDSE
jgi:hypothetical protein